MEKPRQNNKIEPQESCTYSYEKKSIIKGKRLESFFKISFHKN